MSWVRRPSQRKRGRLALAARVALAAALVCALLSVLAACKPTDFFTEIIVSPFADTVWENSPDKIVVDSPDAEEESGELAAIDWTDESPRSEEVQNIVLYSDEPTSTLTTHHSIFDTMPLFKGAQSSDGVRIVFDEQSDVDHEAETDEEDASEDDPEDDDVDSTSIGPQTTVETVISIIEAYNNYYDEPQNSDDTPVDSPAMTASGTQASQSAESEGQTPSGGSGSQASPSQGGGGSGSQASPSQGGGGSGSQASPSEEGGASDAESSPAQEAASGSAAQEATPEAVAGDSSEEAPEPENPGEGDFGDDPGGEDQSPSPGSGEGGDGNDGDTPEPSGGRDPFDGSNDTVYNPNDVFAQANNVQHLAVIGNDAAVLAQSIGGQGAICAMTQYAYYGLDSSGYETMTASRFCDVFADERPATNAILWNGDGSSPSDLVDVDALVQACGQGGVIVFEQTLGTESTLFSYDQREAIYNADIQFIPVDFSTVQGIIDAALVIGDALAESDECAQDARAMSRAYEDFIGDMVKSVTDTHGGSLAGLDATGIRGPMTSYNSLMLATTSTEVRCYIATGWETGLTYTGDRNVDSSGIWLFTNENTWPETPLYFWEQVAGVTDGTARSYSSAAVKVSGHGYSLLYPLYEYSVWPTPENLTGGGRAWSLWANSTKAYSLYMVGRDLAVYETQNKTNYGLGSWKVPYLIVCASDGASAAQVKAAVHDSMVSYYERGAITPYVAFPYDKNCVPVGSITSIWSCLGAAEHTLDQSPFYSGSELNYAVVDAVVRENPVGLLGSWTEGNMESVLESVWLAQVYSEPVEGCAYSPEVDMSGFSVNIGGSTCTTVHDAVCAFYQTFYRYDASGMYSQIVTDE